MGVYLFQRFVVNPKVRLAGAPGRREDHGEPDLVPRICMALMLTVGGILSERWLGTSAWQMAAIILLAPFWLAMVLTIHFKEGQPIAKSIAKFDYWFRWVVVISDHRFGGLFFSTDASLPRPGSGPSC